MNMARVFDRVRRITRFLLAAFLWLHALFLFTPPSSLVSQSARLLHLTASEVLLFGLLVVVSFFTASGFWNTVGCIAYIYGFPFVLLGKVLYRFGLGARALNTWFKSRQTSPLEESLVVEKTPSTIPAPSKGQDRRFWSKQTTVGRRFFLVPRSVADARAKHDGPKAKTQERYWRQDKVANALSEFENNFCLSRTGKKAESNASAKVTPSALALQQA
jgi:hypothetical protein